MTALLIATTFPTLKSAYDLVRHRRINPVAGMVLLGIVTSIVALFIGGDQRIPRPMMFYFGRYFFAGNNPEKRKVFDSRWHNPIIRRGHRLITAVWGFVYTGEFVLRLILIYTLSAAVVLAITQFLLGSATIVTVMWRFRYAYKLRDRVVQ